MSEKTNLYALRNRVVFSPTTPEEIRKFLGINIMMGTLPYPRVRLYWEPKFAITLISNAMPVNRFFKLRQNVHITDDSDKPVVEEQVLEGKTVVQSSEGSLSNVGN